MNRKALQDLGVNETVVITFDLLNGLAYVRLRSVVNGVKTLPDVLPNVHVDYEDGQITGLEDISNDMAKLSVKWIKALKKAKKKLESK